MGSKLFSSGRSGETLDILSRETGLDFVALGRIAISMSIRLDTSPERSTNISGKEFNRYSLLGSDETLFRALLSVRESKRLTDDEFYSNASFIKDHLDRGCMQLSDILGEAGNTIEDAYVYLAEMVE